MSSPNHLVYLLIATTVFSLATFCLGVNGESVDESKNNNSYICSSSSILHQSFQKEEYPLVARNKTFAQEGEKQEKEQETKKIKVIITAYTSEEAQTDDTPFITANGTMVKDGIVANNMLPFGTEIVIPELYGEKVFTVADRMHPRQGNYKVDIWFESKEEALRFGVKETYIEVSQI